MDRKNRRKQRLEREKPTDEAWILWRDQNPVTAAKLLRGELTLLPTVTPDAGQAKLGPVAVAGGRGQGEVVRTTDPHGRIIAQARRLDATPIDRMLLAQQISADLHAAGQRFEADFIRGQLHGLHATNWMRASTGPGDLSDTVVAARQRVARALECLGRLHGLSVRCVWWVVGCHTTLEELKAILGADRSRLSGILVSSLERLAIHYGQATMEETHRPHFDRGVLVGLTSALDLSKTAIATGRNPIDELERKIARQKQRTN